MEFVHYYDSPLGTIKLTSDGDALTGLWFRERLEESEEDNINVFEKVDQWLDIYFAGDIPDFIPEMNLKGTEFQKEIWEILLSIPYGETMNYGEIAKIIAKKRGQDKMSAQAVGGAVGRNPISLIVPCHRVIGTNGDLTGYAGGIERKRRLLELENIGLMRC